jgi:putative ABC transport system permease protein
MNWVALKMLTGDRTKYFGIVFGVMFATLLIAQQVSIFVSLMIRTTNQIRDVDEADIWVMDPKVRYSDEVMALSDSDLQRVRGVPGVAWAVKLFKNQVRARVPRGIDEANEGNFRNGIMLGIDDGTLTGAPREMILGTLADLKQPDAVMIDKAGFEYLWPGEPLQLGKILELNDRRAVLVGICKAGAPFTSMPIYYTRYSQAVRFAPPERRMMSFVLVGSAADVTQAELCERITAQTGLQAITREGFMWKTVGFYLGSTGIPVNFGITVGLGFIVGVAIAGQTFYLFTLENLKQFGALKAMGLSNLRIVGMIVIQALVVGIVGYGLGIGLAGFFFESTKDVTALAGFYMPWQVMAGTGGAVLIIITLASLISIRKVLILEPAIVFR